MNVLEERILKDGKCYPGGILKVDKFINHQMDPNLMKQIAVELIRRYASTEINKIITIEDFHIIYCFANTYEFYWYFIFIYNTYYYSTFSCSI